ncbi:amidohydrolase family protein [Pseudonocardia benzenivorans]
MGGTTTVVDFAIPDPGQRPIDAVAERRKLAEISRCDTALHGCVIQWDATTAGQIAEMATTGVRTIKLFTTYKDVVMAGPDTVLEVLRTLHAQGGIAYVHAEANHVIEDAQASAVAAGEAAAGHMPRTRPELAEAAAVAQVLATAEHVDAPVYFVHQTTAEAVDLVRAARRRGVRAYTETCPHYLYLDEGTYAGDHPERFVCCPPLRAPETVAQLRARALVGDVDTLGSDHCCYSTGQKSEHSHDVRVMPNGLPGVETRLPVTFTQLVVRGGMPVERFVGMFATNPARLNGLTGKGVLAPGHDADLVVLDPAGRRPARIADLHMATDYSPYEGRSSPAGRRSSSAGAAWSSTPTASTTPGPSAAPCTPTRCPTTSSPDGPRRRASLDRHRPPEGHEPHAEPVMTSSAARPGHGPAARAAQCAAGGCAGTAGAAGDGAGCVSACVIRRRRDACLATASAGPVAATVGPPRTPDGTDLRASGLPAPAGIRRRPADARRPGRNRHVAGEEGSPRASGRTARRGAPHGAAGRLRPVTVPRLHTERAESPPAYETQQLQTGRQIC